MLVYWLKSELDKMNEEAAKLKEKNEEKEKEEFLETKTDILIKQERTRRELDPA